METAIAAAETSSPRARLFRLWPVRHLLLVLVLACLLPGIIGTVILITRDYHERRSQLARNTIRTARALLQTVDGHLLNARTTAQALSTERAIRERDFARFHARARETLALAPVGSNVVLSDEHRQLVNTAVDFGQPLLRVGNAGIVRQVLDTGKPAISGLFYGPLLRRQLVSVEVPVIIDGRAAYSLAITVVPDQLNAMLKNARLPADWVVAVVDSSGTIVARTHQPERFVGQKMPARFIESTRPSPEGSLHGTLREGIPVETVYSRSPVSGWTVAMGIPTETLERDLLDPLQVLALGVVVLFAVGLSLAWALGGRIAGSVRALTAPALALGSGVAVPAARVHFEEAAEVGRAMGKTAELLAERTRALQHAALHDPLTALPNRNFLGAKLEEALRRAARHQSQAAVLMIDLDHFKSVNDTFGHPAGDDVLREVGQRLRGSLRQSDTVARLGGDEFAVILEDLHDTEEAGLVAQGLVDMLQQPITLADREIALSGSIGISCYPRDGETAPALIRKADAALYLAKDEGRAAYRFHCADLDDEAARRLFLASSLRGAVARRELVLCYQPRVGLTDCQIKGAEALVRWQSPEHGLVLPNHFIGLAEEIGMIEPIGEWVLREACRQLAAWRRQGLPIDFVSVNLSPRQFHQAQLAERVGELLQEAGLPADALELEIPEGMAMQQPERTERTFRQLAGLGIRLCLDDFGTGHSSLACLQRFPVHHLKLDRSFVQKLPHGKDSAAISRAIVAIAGTLQLGVTAEGVETEAQREFLAAIGCQSMQGYLFSQPVDASALARLLQQSLETLPC